MKVTAQIVKVSNFHRYLVNSGCIKCVWIQISRHNQMLNQILTHQL